MTNFDTLLPSLLSLAREAGEAILQVYRAGEIAVEIKQDNTPVTEADKAANEVIVQGLKKISHFPCISEEGKYPPFSERSQWKTYWLVDPLDGTREFIARTDEFTVNIALIDNHQSIIGIVYAPAKELLYYACKGHGAFKQEGKGAVEKINTRPLPQKPTIAASRNCSWQKLDRILTPLFNYDAITLGSALKPCAIAEGKADIYCRLGPTSEWDTAASQCILEEAGGRFMDMNGDRLLYNTREKILNPEFLVVGDPGFSWEKLLACVKK